MMKIVVILAVVAMARAVPQYTQPLRPVDGGLRPAPPGVPIQPPRPPTYGGDRFPAGGSSPQDLIGGGYRPSPPIQPPRYDDQRPLRPAPPGVPIQPPRQIGGGYGTPPPIQPPRYGDQRQLRPAPPGAAIQPPRYPTGYSNQRTPHHINSQFNSHGPAYATLNRQRQY